MSDAPPIKPSMLRIAGALISLAGVIGIASSFGPAELVALGSLVEILALIGALAVFLRGGFPSRDPAPRALALLLIVFYGLSAIALLAINMPVFDDASVILGFALLSVGIGFGVVTMRTPGITPGIASLPLVLCILIGISGKAAEETDAGWADSLPAVSYLVVGMLFIALAGRTSRLAAPVAPTEAAAATGEPPLVLSPNDADGLVQAADVAFDRREYAESIRLTEQILSQHPRHFNAQVTRARALAAHRRWGDARLAAEELRRQHPNVWAAHSQYALIDIEIHAVTKWTVEAAQEGVRLAPEEPMAHAIAGDVHLTLREVRSAAAAYREALRLDPNHSHARHNLAVAERSRVGTAATGSAFADVLGMSPDFDLAARNIVATLERPLYWLRLILILAYLVTFAMGRYFGSSVATAEDLLPSRIVVGAVAASVIVTVAIWIIRFARATAPRGRRLLGAVVRLDRGLGVVAGLYAIAVLALAAIPLLVPPWMVLAFLVGVLAGIVAIAVGFVRFLISLGN
jgi:tetratricopeptide (TPR) repeat protein